MSDTNVNDLFPIKHGINEINMPSGVVDIDVVLQVWDSDWSITKLIGVYTIRQIVNNTVRVQICIEEAQAKEIIQKAGLHFHKSTRFKDAGVWKSKPPQPKRKSIKL